MPKTIRSLERGLQVLTALQGMSVASLHELHLATRIPKPTLVRILHTLEQRGFISRRLADGRYRANANQGQVRRPGRHDRVIDAAVPVLDRLCRQILWPSDLLVPAGGHMKIVETSQAHSPFLINVSRIGQPVNWLLSAVGRTYLAYCPETEREAILERLRKSDLPVNRLARNPKRLARILAETRARGYGIRDPLHGSRALGNSPGNEALAAIAVPLLDGTRVHGVINILWIKTAFTVEQFAAQHLDHLRSAAAEIVATLGAAGERLRTRA